MPRYDRAADARCSPSPFGDGLVVRRVADQQWHAAPSCFGPLIGDAGLRLGEWIAHGDATVVKQGAHRAVFRIVTSTETFFVKQYRLAGPRAWLQNNIRPCRAYREAAGIALLSEIGVPTAELIAAGRSTFGPFSRESFVVTRALDDVTPLDEWIARDRVRCEQIIEPLSLLLASLHRHGLFHADFHAGNILVRECGRDIELFLIDLLPLRRAAMTSSRRWSMVAMLATSLSQQTNSADRERFLKCYARSLGVRDDPVAVSQFCTHQIKCRHARADRKWRRGNRHVSILDTRHVACRGLSELGRDQLIEWRDAIARGEAASTPPAVVLRRIAPGAAARTCWEVGHALLRRGVPVTRPLLFVHQRGEGAILIERAAPVIPFEEWIGSAPSDPAARDAVLVSVGRLLRTLDDAGFHVSRDALAITETGQAIVDRHEHVAPSRRWLPAREASRRTVLAQISHLADRQRVDDAYRVSPRPAPAALPSDTGKLRRARTSAAAVLLVLLTFIAGCRSLEKPPATAALPAKHSVRAEQLVLISDFRLAKDDPLVNDLINLREQVVGALQLPEPRQDVVVYMFSNEDTYRNYLETVHPGLPSRRAYFVGTKSELAVYTYWGDRIQEDLRHEYTHGILHASLAAVPLWLDEGLAEYFEVAGPTPGGMNGDYPHQLAIAVANGWRPDIDRLEQVEEFSQLRRIDYQESWAWVHYLLHASPETRQELLAYLADLRDSTRPPSLSGRIASVQPGYPARFLGYVATLNSSGGAVIRASSAEL